MGCHRHQELEDKLTSDVGDCWSNNFGCLSSTLKASNSSRFWSIMQPFQARSALRWKSIGALVYRLGMWMIWMEAFIAAFLPRPSPSAISICFPIMALATWRTCFIPTLYSPCHQTSSDSLMPKLRLAKLDACHDLPCVGSRAYSHRSKFLAPWGISWLHRRFLPARQLRQLLATTT